MKFRERFDELYTSLLLALQSLFATEAEWTAVLDSWSPILALAEILLYELSFNTSADINHTIIHINVNMFWELLLTEMKVQRFFSVQDQLSARAAGAC